MALTCSICNEVISIEDITDGNFTSTYDRVVDEGFSFCLTCLPLPEDRLTEVAMAVEIDYVDRVAATLANLDSVVY